ncbi:MAG: DNA polymerase III subunit gamma/tau [Saprospirales bacterium]|nr:MAG: DNA polymerase III subunit gamma/tau [Saprospirales bacterium]
MSFQVSALKYRPQRFEEVVGQDHVTSTLTRSLQAGKVAHALLFCGPRGVGKTTIARILAKALNCEDPGSDREPCNKCVSCESFNSGASMNIIELDAASNNKVEDIRHLVEQVGYQPQRGSHKVFIIDEVHMLTSSAFNAFLKTLEEPPPYAVFILATTEKHKILPTILSRCQIYDFKRIPIADMVGQMKDICGNDGIEFEEEGLSLIAQKADGALRDALSLFDKLNAVTEGKLTYQNVIQSLNILDREHFFEFVDWFLAGDTAGPVQSFNRILDNGFEGDILLDGLQEHYRELFVAYDPNTRNLMQSGDRFSERYIDQAGRCSRSFLLSSMNVISDSLFKYKEATNKKLFTELCLCKLAVIDHFLNNAVSALPGDQLPGPTLEKKNSESSPVEKIVEAPEKPTKTTQATEAEPAETAEEKSEPKDEKPQAVEAQDPGPAKADDKLRVSESAKKGPVAGKKLPKLQSLGSLKDRIKKKKEDARSESLEFTLENVKQLWNQELEKIKSKSVLVALKNTILSVEDNKVRIGTSGEVAKQTVRMQEKLLEKLRSAFDRDDIAVKVYVDDKLKAKSKKAKPRFTTTREKFDFMKKENPALAKLMKELDLKITD